VKLGTVYDFRRDPVFLTRQAMYVETYCKGAFAKPLLAWKNSKCFILWVCVCSLRYPACSAHAPYYIVICVLSHSTIFFTLSHKRHNFRKKKVIEHV